MGVVDDDSGVLLPGEVSLRKDRPRLGIDHETRFGTQPSRIGLDLVPTHGAGPGAALKRLYGFREGPAFLERPGAGYLDRLGGR